MLICPCCLKSYLQIKPLNIEILCTSNDHNLSILSIDLSGAIIENFIFDSVDDELDYFDEPTTNDHGQYHIENMRLEIVSK